MRFLFTLLSVVLLPGLTLAADYKAYFGLLHAHTHYSDGIGDPDEAFQMARDAGLDFFALTEHNHSEAAGDDGVYLTDELYEVLMQTAASMTEDGEFVAIWGQELSTISKGNHLNVFYAPEVCDMPSGQFRYLYENWMPSQAGAQILQFNHPRGGNSRNTIDYGIDDYGNNFGDLVQACDRYACLIEMIKGSAQSDDDSSSHRNGQYEDEYFFYLNKGFHLAPSAGGDDHRRTWGTSMHGRIGVWATELSRTGLEEAITNRRCFATEDDSIQVQFTVNGSPMGSFVQVNDDDSVALKVTFNDPGEAGARHRVIIYHDSAVGGSPASEIENEIYDPGVTEATFTHVAEPGSYYFAKVVQISDHPDDTWTAPVWLTAAAENGENSEDSQPENTDDPPRDRIEWDEAPDYVNEEITVSGTIIRAHHYQQNGETTILFLNFDEDFTDTLTLVAFDDDFEAFGGPDELEQRLVGKRVTVHGEITIFQNSRMQMVLRNADQITEVEGEEQ